MIRKSSTEVDKQKTYNSIVSCQYKAVIVHTIKCFTSIIQVKNCRILLEQRLTTLADID